MMQLDDEQQIIEQLKSKSKERKKMEESFLAQLADQTDQCRIIAKKTSKNNKLKARSLKKIKILKKVLVPFWTAPTERKNRVFYDRVRKKAFIRSRRVSDEGG
jgi:hypothetical protein